MTETKEKINILQLIRDKKIKEKRLHDAQIALIRHY